MSRKVKGRSLREKAVSEAINAAAASTGLLSVPAERA